MNKRNDARILRGDAWRHARGAADKKHKAGQKARIIYASAAQTRRAAGRLRHTDPLASAAIGITRAQKTALGGALVFTLGIFSLAPSLGLTFVHHALWLFFASLVVFRFSSVFIGQTRPPDPPAGDDIVPVYSILIALYHEATVLPDLFRAIEALDYPRSRLDVKLLLEADDHETIKAAKDIISGAHWQIIIVPPIGPQTKPKALNVGLARAWGSHVVIYDAEDRPHPQQLRHALAAFSRDTARKLGCVQAPLDIYNAQTNWLSRQFALEYATHFHLVLPALARLGLPFPLGGTSNHFRTLPLRSVGGWDPYNVTEDADLGFRLSAHGWQSTVIAPPTFEEAPTALPGWLGQRSRWLKGYLQTLSVQTRRPAQNRRAIGAFSLLFSLGAAALTALGNGAVLLTLLTLVACAPWFGFSLSMADAGLALGGFGVGIFTLIVGARRAGIGYGAADIISLPFYWALQSIAMVMAVRDLITRPFHWVKTTHGEKSSNGR